MARRKPFISRRIGYFTWDRRVLLALVLLGAFIAARAWLNAHPEHDPWAPLDLRDPPGWATARKLAALRDNIPECRAVLTRSAIAHTVLPGEGKGACARPDRTRLDGYPFSPDRPTTTCQVAVALKLWERDALGPAARELFDSEIEAVEHLGAFSCRRLYGRDSGAWSEHATGNAVDIAGFVLADGTRISVLRDWPGDGPKARFLRQVRDGACASFSTVLSPDYNAAHADHFHLDMRGGWGGTCR